MRVKKYKTLHQITFLQHVFPINCYLIYEDDGATLIDTGMGFCGKYIQKAAVSLGYNINRIILSHSHGDHTSSLDFIKTVYPNATVYISERDNRLLQGDYALDPDEPQTKIKGSFAKSIKTPADVLLQDGDTVGSLKAILIPGHTPGSTVFYDERSKALIAGDVFQTKSGLAVAGDIRPFFPFIATATWNKNLAVVNSKCLLDLEIDVLATGHGNLLKNPIPSMKKAIHRAENKLPEGDNNG